jgi:hypothetical protein
MPEPTQKRISNSNSTQPDPGSGSTEIGRRIAPVNDFRPLEDTRPDTQRRYEKLAKRSARNPLDAIKLKCIECCGWDFVEAKRCDIKCCPLWSMNRRIFHGEGRPKRSLRGTAPQNPGRE